MKFGCTLSWVRHVTFGSLDFPALFHPLTVPESGLLVVFFSLFEFVPRLTRFQIELGTWDWVYTFNRHPKSTLFGVLTFQLHFTLSQPQKSDFLIVWYKETQKLESHFFSSKSEVLGRKWRKIILLRGPIAPLFVLLGEQNFVWWVFNYKVNHPKWVWSKCEVCFIHFLIHPNKHVVFRNKKNKIDVGMWYL